MGKLDIQKIVSEELSELTEKEKRKILHDLDEAKVTPLKVSKAYDALAKVTAELLKNLKAYKDATTDSDKEKYKKVAATLTAKKKQAQKLLNSMIVQLDKDAELHLENIIRGELNESNAKDVFKFAKEALLQTTKGRRLDQRYVRDYLKSIEQMARKKPGQFVKDYKDFGVADWIEDVEYNMRNESVNESVEKDLMKAKKGAKAKGGGYGPFVKISGNSWKNPKTGRLMHSQALASHIGGFNDFIIEGKLTEIKKGDYVDSMGEIGLVNKVKGQVAYVKFDSNPKSFHPMMASSLNKSGKKHKGKDLYTEGKLTEALNPKKASKVIFDKLVFAKLIGQQNRKRAEGIIEFQLRAMNFGEGKLSEGVYDNILKAVPDSYSYKNLAADIARIIKDEYGSHNIKPFTKELIKALKEGSVNEATNLWKHFDAKMKLQDEIMDLEMDMKMINRDLSQLHKDMEQEAEPEGGPKATRYGKEIDKKEKEYKQKKAQFKKLMAKLDKMEQY